MTFQVDHGLPSKAFRPGGRLHAALGHAALAICAGPAFAGGELMPVRSIRHATLDYSSGVISGAGGVNRSSACWSSTDASGYFLPIAPHKLLLDWGDLDASCESPDRFSIGYATDSLTPVTCDIVFYSDENGFDSVGRTPLYAFQLSGLPGGVSGPGVYSGWAFTINIGSPIDLTNVGTASDLDGDGRIDFGYSFNFRAGSGSSGPLIAAADPNIVPYAAPGIEDAYDRFHTDSNQPPGPNELLLPGYNTNYWGSDWFGGVPFAQFYFQFDSNACSNICPSGVLGDLKPGPSGDGDVDLADLGMLLANYGAGSVSCAEGDIEPTCGDGDVDLEDLVAILGPFGQFGGGWSGNDVGPGNSSTLIQLTTTADDPLIPPDRLIVDVASIIPSPLASDWWTGSGISGQVSAPDVTLVYATDPNTGNAVLTAPGLANQYVTFVSRPLTAPTRFQTGSALPGGMSPLTATPQATSTLINVAQTTFSPSSSGVGVLDAGWVTRVALALGASYDEYTFYESTTGPADPIDILLFTGQIGITTRQTPCVELVTIGVYAAPPPRPHVISHPQSKVICTGGGHTLSVTASGATSYQWFKDGEFVASGPTLAISGADDLDDGLYQAIVSNAGGQAHSEYALVAVLDPNELPPVLFPEQRVPEAWQGAVEWVNDVSPKNKIDDALDNDPNLPAVVPVVVNMNSQITQNAVNDLAALGTIELVGQYVPAIFMELNIADVSTVANRADVAFIELQKDWSYHLDVATQTTKVTNGAYSPCTVETRHPGFDGTGVNIAIMDSGVDDPFGPGVTHLGLPAAMFFYNAATNSYTNPDDTLGHGTHVAGIALGRGFGSVPRGVAPNAGLIDISIRNASNAQIFNALQTLITRRVVWNVGVVNMSFGWPGPSDGREAYSQLVDYATSLGITVVAAGGNSGTAPMGTPASANGSITVGNSEDQSTATRADDTLRASSQRGPRASNGNGICHDELKPDVTAPGTSIRSTSHNSTNGGVSLTGTSMSAPHVAGVAALLRQANRTLTPGGIKAVLRRTAEPRGGASNPACDPTWNNGWGWGLIDANAAMETARGQAPSCSATQLPTDVGFVNDPRPYATTRVNTLTPPKLNVPNQIQALVKNFGVQVATNVPVRFAIYYITTANGSFYDVGTVVVPTISPNQEVLVSIPWTPRHVAHQCLRAFVEYPADTNSRNNESQRNITVANSPVYFHVANYVSATPIVIDFVAEFETPGSLWAVQFTPPEVTLAAGEAVVVEALPVPPNGAPDGQAERIWVEARTSDCLLLGGIGIDAKMEDCNGNGVDDWFDILNGVSEDANNDTTPDECDCPADLDHSGAVDLPDLAILLSHFGGPGGPAQGDMDHDGDVDLTDLSLLLAQYGSACPA